VTRLIRLAGDCFLAAADLLRFDVADDEPDRRDPVFFVALERRAPVDPLCLGPPALAPDFAADLPREVERADVPDDLPRVFRPDDFDPVAMIVSS